jgi:hypothetical protein
MPRAPKLIRASSFRTSARFPDPGHMDPPNIFRGYTHLILGWEIDKAMSMSPWSQR